MTAQAHLASSGARRVTPRRTWRGRLLAPLLGAAAALLRRLPDRALHRLAQACGGLLYRAQPARAALVRDNLRRVCRWLSASGMGGPRVARAAADERSLERLVREAFGHYLRSYLEGAISPVYAGPRGRGRIAVDDAAAVDEMLGPSGGDGRPAIVIGMHFGAMEIIGIHAVAERGVSMTTPMETITDPDLQAYFVRTRGATGLNIIPTTGAGRELAARLAAGEPVGLVADRAVAGAGARVELFGAPARLPLGPAVLALESGAPAWAVAARRTGYGSYRARVERLHVPLEGSRRQRLSAFLEAEARAFERLVADAPEQWWTLFFPIWEQASGSDSKPAQAP